MWEGWRVGGRGVAGLSQVSQEVERPLLFTATFFMRLKNKVFSTNFSYYYDYVHMVVSEPYKILKNVSIFPENLFSFTFPKLPSRCGGAFLGFSTAEQGLNLVSGITI